MREPPRITTIRMWSRSTGWPCIFLAAFIEVQSLRMALFAQGFNRFHIPSPRGRGSAA